MEKFPFRIQTVRTENSYEFQEKLYCNVKNKRTGTANFFLTTRDVDLNEKLNGWEAFYNFQQPHGAFKGKALHEILKEKR